MVFSSIPFLFVFAPGVLGLHALTPRRWRNLLLLLASLAFYTIGAGGFVAVLVLTTAVDHRLALWIEAARERGDGDTRRRAVMTSVVVNLAMLGVFKYANFAVDQIDVLRGMAGLEQLPWVDLALPIGISFFTFQRLSYVLDVSRGVRPALRSFTDLLLFVALFPQLIAGPIVRYDEIADQLHERHAKLSDMSAGAARFTLGLAKKVLIADTVAPLADELFAASGSLSAPAAWLAAIAYAIQIYYDFSGYSDMAIGLGRMLGFRFPENFAGPYAALSVTDFWRRWHITLSEWFRDYVYIPLGGSRADASSTYRNLLIVFLLTGLWHGAAWTFIIWGLYHGAFLALERLTDRRRMSADSIASRLLPQARTFAIVLVGWVLFRAPDLPTAWEIIRAMFVGGFDGLPVGAALALDARTTLVLWVALVASLVPRERSVGAWLDDLDATVDRRAVARLAVVGLALPAAGLAVLAGSFSPFLYFRF